MSDAVILALIAMPASIFTALAVLVTARGNRQHADRNADRLEHVTISRAAEVKATAVEAAAALRDLADERQNATDAKLDEIHVMVNDRLDRALREIAELHRRLGAQDPDSTLRQDAQ